MKARYYADKLEALNSQQEANEFRRDMIFFTWGWMMAKGVYNVQMPHAAERVDSNIRGMAETHLSDQQLARVREWLPDVWCEGEA